MKFIKTFENLGYNSNKISNSFFDKYPKKETKIYFKDRESTYELYLHDFKLDKLIFKTESGSNVVIGNPYNVSEADLQKISILPVDITDESKKVVDEMFDYKIK